MRHPSDGFGFQPQRRSAKSGRPLRSGRALIRVHDGNEGSVSRDGCQQPAVSARRLDNEWHDAAYSRQMRLPPYGRGEAWGESRIRQTAAVIDGDQWKQWHYGTRRSGFVAACKAGNDHRTAVPFGKDVVDLPLDPDRLQRSKSDKEPERAGPHTMRNRGCSAYGCLGTRFFTRVCFT